ncbi:MAG TPA: Fic family protein [Coriobacteriia bacterium]|jgi:Fic family protein
MFPFIMTDEIDRDLRRLEDLRARPDARGPLPRKWVGRMRRELEAEAVAASTSMEGVAVTVDEVRRILAGEKPREVSAEDAGLVRGYADAMRYVLLRADDPNFHWHPELFLAIHSRVLADSYVNEAGRFRSIQNRLTDRRTGRQVFVPPPPEVVPRLVADLAEWLEASAEVATPVRAALAHVRLAAIHPFRDGNGRTARILASLVMYRGGFKAREFTSLEEWWGAHLADYYTAFDCLGEAWDPEADVTPFVAAHVRGQVTQVEALSLRQAVEQGIWTVLQDIATEDLGADPRVANALYDAFFGREVTNRYYRELADVETVTASHDLRRLLASGLVVATGKGRSSAYRGSAELGRRVAEAAGVADSRFFDAGASLDRQREEIVLALGERMRGGLRDGPEL